MKLLNKIPLPITGLTLGLAALGNLLASHSLVARYTLGLISAFLLITVILKIIFNFNQFKTDLNHPVISSVFPTFSMTIMVLSTYLVKSNFEIAKYLYLSGVIIHFILIVIFTYKFIINFNIKKVFPSYFIVFVGIVVGSVCAPAMKMNQLGQQLFWFGFITYFLVLAVVTYRVVKVKEIPEPALPTLLIYSAPASLLLAGYNASFAMKNSYIHILLITLSLLFYGYALSKLWKLLQLKFYPSYSAFTFPFVISAIAIKTTKVEFFNFTQIALIQTVIATILVLYVLYRYTLNFIKN